MEGLDSLGLKEESLEGSFEKDFLFFQVYRPGALTKSQSQSQHMVRPLEGPKEGKEGQKVDRLGHRLRKASPRKGVA